MVRKMMEYATVNSIVSGYELSARQASQMLQMFKQGMDSEDENLQKESERRFKEAFAKKKYMEKLFTNSIEAVKKATDGVSFLVKIYPELNPPNPNKKTEDVDKLKKERLKKLEGMDTKLPKEDKA